eukprot:scaffold30952_cov17-Tisochrysis_lutea.AAC.1
MSATTFATNWPWLAMTGFLGSRPGQGKGKGAGLSTGSFFHQCRIWLLGACIQEEQLTMTDSIADTCSQFTKGCSPRKRTVGKALMPSSPQNCLFGSASMSWITEGREGKSYSSGDGFSLERSAARTRTEGFCLPWKAPAGWDAPPRPFLAP